MNLRYLAWRWCLRTLEKKLSVSASNQSYNGRAAHLQAVKASAFPSVRVCVY